MFDHRMGILPYTDVEAAMRLAFSVVRRIEDMWQGLAGSGVDLDRIVRQAWLAPA